MDDKNLHDLIRKAYAPISPSDSFDRTFRQKIEERNAESFGARLRRLLDAWLPAPRLAPAFAAVSFALVLGGTAGAAAELRAPRQAEPVFKTLSGFSEFKGVPSPSLTGSYLRLMEGNGP